MSCWKTLGIEAGADKKTIKLAYAKLLKQTRPDDDPEGFAVLHNAYKTALSARPGSTGAGPVKSPSTNLDLSQQADVAKSARETRKPETSSVLPRPVAVDEIATVDAAPVVEILNAPEESVELLEANTDEVDEQDDFQYAEHQQALLRDAELIESQVMQLIASPRRARNVEEWKFIESVPSMVDLNFSSRMSDQIFELVSETNMESLKTSDLQIEPPVLRYLSEQFQWEKDWQRLEAEYGEEQVNAIFLYINSNRSNSKDKSLHYFTRILAFAVDLIVGGICMYIAANTQQPAFVLTIAAMYYLLVIPLMEASVLQASVGKYMFELAVVDKSGLRLKWYHSFIRSYITYLLLAAIKIVIWINVFTSFKYNLLLQDLITKSHVVERKRKTDR